MTDWIDDAQTLINTFRSKKEGLDGVDALKLENRLKGDACELVETHTSNGDMSEQDVAAFAGQLSDVSDSYTKTDLKDEFGEYIKSTDEDGIPLDDLIENRLEEIVIVTTTDHKQSTVWRFKFSDTVVIETETSKEGTRKHHSWPLFQKDYFDELVALGKGEQIAKPTEERQDTSDWVNWIDDLILSQSTIKQHVGPRTETVRQLQDVVERNTAHTDIEDVRTRQGVWAWSEGTVDDHDDIEELRIPFAKVERVCDQIGISTRALQIELEARGHGIDGINGVSDYTHHDGVRVAYWRLDPSFAEPELHDDSDDSADSSDDSDDNDDDNNETTNDGLGEIDSIGFEEDEEQ